MDFNNPDAYDEPEIFDCIDSNHRSLLLHIKDLTNGKDSERFSREELIKKASGDNISKEETNTFLGLLVSKGLAYQSAREGGFANLVCFANKV